MVLSRPVHSCLFTYASSLPTADLDFTSVTKLMTDGLHMCDTSRIKSKRYNLTPFCSIKIVYKKYK